MNFSKLVGGLSKRGGNPKFSKVKGGTKRGGNHNFMEKLEGGTDLGGHYGTRHFFRLVTAQRYLIITT